MTKTYSVKTFRQLVPMTREALPLLGSFDPFGGGIEPWLIRWIANSAGVWLQVNDNYGNQGPLSMREVEGMSSFNPDELEVSHVDGVGYCYGLPGGKPILPFQFTAVQLFEFDQRQGGLVRGNFYSGAEEAEAQLTELEQTNPEAAELARIIFSGVMPEQQATTPGPAPVVAAKRNKKKPSIETVALDYMCAEFKQGQFQSASKFHKHLINTAGQDKSPFEMGKGTNARKLFCPAASSFYDLGTLSKIWAKIRAG